MDYFSILIAHQFFSADIKKGIYKTAEKTKSSKI